MREGGENHIGPQEFFPALPHPPTPFLFPSTVQKEGRPNGVGASDALHMRYWRLVFFCWTVEGKPEMGGGVAGEAGETTWGLMGFLRLPCICI
jgi:hypothetical protein